MAAKWQVIQKDWKWWAGTIEDLTVLEAFHGKFTRWQWSMHGRSCQGSRLLEGIGGHRWKMETRTDFNNSVIKIFFEMAYN